jgi:HlyD family secretion protein
VIVAIALRSTVLTSRPIEVDVARVTRGVVQTTVTNTRAGTVKARRRARLVPETGGRVVELPHRKGSHVRRGDVLVRLDSSMQRAQLTLAIEDVRVATAKADEACRAAEAAQTELTRITRLRRDGVASDQTVDNLSSERDRSRAACRAARATFDQTQARQHLAQIELDRTELRAPFDGVVAELNTEIGEWIAPGLPVLTPTATVELLDPSSVYVSAPIDEMDAERVRVGQRVEIEVDSRRGERFPGHLVRVAPYVQDVVEQNRTIEVEAELDDPQVAASLLPGTSADVEVIISQRDGVLRIPTEALRSGNKVLVVVGDRLEERAVKPGLRNWRTIEVLEGLREGELVARPHEGQELEAGARVAAREVS